MKESESITKELKTLNSLMKKILVVQMVSAELNNEQLDVHTRLYEESHNE